MKNVPKDVPINDRLLDDIRDNDESYTKQLTLDEIKENHGAMFAELTKDFKHYNFGYKIQACRKFMAVCLDNSLKRLGVRIPQINNVLTGRAELLYAEAVEKNLNRNNVKIEEFSDKYKGKDAWMNGLYVYKDDILEFFISQPMTLTPNQFAINRNKSFCVITNAKV